MLSTYLSFLVALLKVLPPKVKTFLQKPATKRAMGILAIAAGIAVAAYGLVHGR